MNRLFYGLDFGTTNSAIALNDRNSMRLLPVGKDSNTLIRSVLFFPFFENAFYVGEEAILQYIESGMKGRFVQSIKKLLPADWFRGTVINGKHHTIEKLVSLIMAEVKKQADAITQNETTVVVLGRPASFSEDTKKERVAEDRLIKAAEMAGFKEVCLQIEPIAAALSYESTLSASELVLVADFGGGTSDFALIEVGPEKICKRNRKSDILATRGISLGGDLFNSEIMWHKLVKYFGAGTRWRTGDRWLHIPNHIMYTLRDWHQISSLYRKARDREFIDRLLPFGEDKEAIKRLHALIKQQLGFSLFQSIEQTKHDLSKDNSSRISFDRSVIHINEAITRKEFEEMIADYVQQINACIDEVFNLAGVKDLDIDRVFLVGGTSYVPKIGKLFTERFGTDVIRSGNKFTSVAEGLAKSSYLFD